MVFSSMFFIWVFLPIVLILSRVVPKKGQNTLLLIASLIFYAWGEPVYIILMLVCILGNYLLVLWMNRSLNIRGFLLFLSIAFNIGILGYFKYADFLINVINRIAGREVLGVLNLPLPIGISFFTFQAMSYVIDFYRGDYPAEKNFLNLALYISFFPQLIAGPIVKFRDIRQQLSSRKIDGARTAEGMRRFIYGLGKKVLIANTIGLSVDNIYGVNAAYVTSPMAWFAAIGYMMQIYYDFSGYSDMAIGLAKMFGFDIQENFNYPYLSLSIREFWRRWHISLGSWFREYVYIPLGGNRRGLFFTVINTLIVFAATGLWHGADATFMLWGLWHGLFVVIEVLGFSKVLKKAPALGWIYTFFVAMLGWILFRTVNLEHTFAILDRMFRPWLYRLSAYSFWEFVGKRMFFAVILGILFMGPVQSLLKKKFPKLLALKNTPAELVFCMGIFFLSILSLTGNTYNPFIYFRF